MAGRPVEAQPQTAFYRLSKFVRRRWLTVAATSVCALGIAGASVVAVLEARAARAEALKSEQVNQFLTEMLSDRITQRVDFGKYTVEQMLEAADRRLQEQDRQKGHKPRTESAGGSLTLAELHARLAVGFLGQQEYDRAQFHLDRAIPVFRAAGDDRDLAEALTTQALSQLDQGHYQEADRSYQETLARFRRLGNAAPAEEVFEVKRQYGQLLSLLMHTRPREVSALFDDLLATGARDPSIPRVEVARAMANRSMLLLNQGKFPEAEAATLEALAMGRREDPGGAWEQDPLFALTVIYADTHKYQAGKEAARRMIEVNDRNFGPDSAIAAQARNTWAGFAAESGEPAAAAQAIRDSMPVIEKTNPSPSLNLWYAERNASNVMRAAGEYREAERYARESLAVTQAAHLAEDDTRTGNSWEALGRALYEEKKYAEAIPVLEKAELAYRHGAKAWTPKADEMRQLIDAPRK